MTKNNTNEMFANFPDVVDVSGLRTMLGGIGEQKAYELVRKGSIKAIKIGKLYRHTKNKYYCFFDTKYCLNLERSFFTMYNITAYLTIKNKTFYTVLTYYVEGQRKLKWISTGIKENESKKNSNKR